MRSRFRTAWLAGVSALALTLGAAGSSWAQEVNAEVGLEDDSVFGNTAQDIQSIRTNAIDGSDDNAGSFNGSSGVAHVQQNNGSNNSIGAASAVSGGLKGNVNVGVGAGVISSTFENLTQHDGNADFGILDRGNRIDQSFNNYAGAATVQQNNGDHNEIGAANAIYGSIADLGTVSQSSFANGSTSNQGGTGPNGELVDEGSNRLNSIDPSFTGASGLATVQQNNGTANAISAATSVVGAASTTGVLFQSSGAFGSITNQAVIDNSIARRNDILSSFDSYSGVVTVQQNNGDANVMSAATAVAAVTGSAAGVSQSASANGSVTGVTVTDNAPSPLNVISTSFDGASGVMTVQQNNGSINVMSAATTVAATGGVGNIFQSVFKGGTVTDNTVVDNSPGFSQDFTQGFNNASGVATVQQNNGSANVMSAATAVAVSKGFATQQVFGNDTVLNNSVTDNSTGNFNTLSSSFISYNGVATVQQNNGHANVISAATAVAANNGLANQFVSKGQVVAFNTVNDAGGNDQNGIFSSFGGASGVATVQQNNGHANAIDAATAVAVVDANQQVSTSGLVEDNEITDLGGFNQNRVFNSFVNYTGVATVQQNNGHGNAIAAATAVVDAAGSFGPTQFANAFGSVGSIIENETLDQESTRSNLIDTNSFNGSAGVSTVQQNNGNANALQVANAVESNTGAGLVGQSATASGAVADNVVQDIFNTSRRNEIFNSYNGAAGVMTVQQNNGDGNVMAASTAVAHSTGDGFTTDVQQSVGASGTVASTFSTDFDAPNSAIGERVNIIDPSFNGASGVVTAQQNNGSNNVVAAASGVFTDRTTGFDPGDEDVLLQNASTSGSVTGTTFSFEFSQNITPPPYDRQNQILNGSFDGFAGTATVQQNNGDHNVVAAATAVAARVDALDDFDNVGTTAPAAASTSGTVDQAGSFDSQDIFANRQNEIGASFNEAQGIITVQENNGNSNVMGSATGVVANIGVTGDTFHGSVANSATGTAFVTNNEGLAFASQRDNAITDSFNGGSMVGTVQQNNGDNNVMGASTQVTASNGGGLGFGPAMSLASLGATVTGNSAIVLPSGGVVPTFTNSISGSFNGTAGVVTVQQNNGTNNAIQSAVTVVSNF